MQEHSRAERWLPIPGWSDQYEVSDRGRVRSRTRTHVHLKGKRRGMTVVTQGKPRRIQVGKTGYEYVTLAKGGKTLAQRVHRLVLLAFVGPPSDPEMVGCHNDGDTHNNHLSNLRWDTTSANMRDKDVHGTNFYANKDCCPQEHLYAGPNLLVKNRATVSGIGQRRDCRACDQARCSINYLRRQGRPAPDFYVLADQKYEKIMRNYVAPQIPAQRVESPLLTAVPQNR